MVPNVRFHWVEKTFRAPNWALDSGRYLCTLLSRLQFRYKASNIYTISNKIMVCWLVGPLVTKS